MNVKRNLNLIQVLRGVASLLVVLYHTTSLLKENTNLNFLGGFFMFGGAGVDIFFVLSGFIITYSSKQLIQKNATFFLFLKRRFVRIFPVYWLLISALLLLQALLPSFYKTHYDFTFANLLSTYFLFPQHIMLNGVSWTLSYELFFYFLFSLTFLIKNKNILIGMSFFYLAAIIILPLFGFDYESGGKWYNLIFFPMNIEFFMGITVALLIAFLPTKIAKPFIIIGTLLFLCGGILSNYGIALAAGPFNRVLLFGIPSFFLIAGVVKLEFAKEIKTHGIFIALGEASYSLYLVHLPLIAAFLKVAGKYLSQSILLLHAAAFITIIIVSIASIYFFRLVEKPMINKINKALN